VSDRSPRELDKQQALRASVLAEAAEVASKLRHECRTLPVNLAYLRILLDEAVALDQRVQQSGPLDQPLTEAMARATGVLEAAATAQTRRFATKVASEPRRSRQRQPTLQLPEAARYEKPELPESISVLAHAARQALIAAACEHVCLSWPQLCRRMSRPKLARLGADTIFTILSVVDHDPRNPHRPLLSALLTESDPPRPGDIFMRIASEHGQRVPTSASRRREMRAKEIEAVYAYWPSTVAPDRSSVAETEATQRPPTGD
jgi:hypothetical protein